MKATKSPFCPPPHRTQTDLRSLKNVKKILIQHKFACVDGMSSLACMFPCAYRTAQGKLRDAAAAIASGRSDIHQLDGYIKKQQQHMRQQQQQQQRRVSSMVRRLGGEP